MAMRNVFWFGVLTTGLALFFSLGQPASARADLTNRYSFTTDASDSVGTRNGTLAGGAYVAGGAVVFDGASAYVSLGGNNISSMTSVTLMSWGTYSAEGESLGRIFDFGGNNAENGHGENYVYLCVGPPASGNQLYVCDVDPFTNWGRQLGIAGTDLRTGSLVQTAAVFDDVRDTFSLYVNGSLVSSGSMGGESLASISGEKGYLGKSLWSSDPFMKGSLTEFRIYNAALSDTDIASAYAVGPNVVPEPTTLVLLAYGLLGLLAYAWRRQR